MLKNELARPILAATSGDLISSGLTPSEMLLQTIDMQQSPGAALMRADFSQSGGHSSITNYGTGQAFIDTIANPFTASWSGTGMQVGGFSGATVRNNDDGTATFTVTNVAGMNSFFYHIAPNNTASTGPMHNVTQTFIWTEPISSSLSANGGEALPKVSGH